MMMKIRSFMVFNCSVVRLARDAGVASDLCDLLLSFATPLSVEHRCGGVSFVNHAKESTAGTDHRHQPDNKGWKKHLKCACFLWRGGNEAHQQTNSTSASDRDPVHKLAPELSCAFTELISKCVCSILFCHESLPFSSSCGWGYRSRRTIFSSVWYRSLSVTAAVCVLATRVA
jgi:hypothetical protein